MSDVPDGRLDVTTLALIARRAGTHQLFATRTYEPSTRSPRRLELRLLASASPPAVESARIDVRWFDIGDYSVHYVEQSADAVSYQCRWDRHPETDTSHAHYHPPPDAGDPVETPLPSHHPLDVTFAILAWVADRVGTLHGWG